MSLKYIHSDVSSKAFPFNFRELSSTVVVNTGLEQNRQLINGFYGDDVAQNYGICQAFFMQNVLPITRGYSSVHYIEKLGVPLPEGTSVDRIFMLRDSLGNLALFSPAGGANLIYDSYLGEWIGYPVAGAVNANVTVQYLKGVTYICIAGFGVYVYDFLTQTFAAQTLIGIDMSSIVGICACNNYLLLYTGTTLLWSDPINPLDFTPAIGGAGSTQILSARSPILFMAQISNGFITYTGINAIASQYTGNPQFPFVFQEIPDSGGVSGRDHVGYQTNNDAHIAWTSAGMQNLTFAHALNIYDELSDSIGRGIYTAPDTDTGKNSYPKYAYWTHMEIKITSIGSRFMIYSVRNRDAEDPQFPFAYVYDSAVGRWGRLDIPHADCIEFSAPEFSTYETWDDLMETTWEELMGTRWDDLYTTPPETSTPFGITLGLINAAGKLFVAVLAENSQLDGHEADQEESGASTPNIVFGKYKIIHPNAVIMQEIVLNTLLNSSPVLYGYALTANGQLIRSDAITAKNPNTGSQWFTQIFGDSVSLGIQGKFTISDILIGMEDGGADFTPQLLPTP